MYDLPIYQACMKIGKKDFNKFLDKFIVLAEKDLQTTKLLLQKGDAKICIKYSKREHLVSHLQLIVDVLPIMFLYILLVLTIFFTSMFSNF